LFIEQYPEIAYVSFGNEINYYLRAHWSDVPSYRKMCQTLYTYVKDNYPHIDVLVIFGFTGMEKKEEEMIPEFLPACDVVGISSYHASISIESQIPHLEEEEMYHILEYCIKLCNGKRVAIVETCAFSYPDPVYQATYVHVFFDIIRKYREEMEFACWYTTYDSYPGTPTMLLPFLEQFNTAGLLLPDGTPKLSYYAWMEEMSQLGIATESPYRLCAAISAVVLILCLLKARDK
jgi:hypothetical protein